MRPVGLWMLVAAVALAWAGVARAQPARPAVFAAASVATAKRSSVQQREEWRFLKEAAAASRFESEASRMALAKSSDPAVRSFAAALIDHQASTGPALQHMLHRRGLAPPMLANQQRRTLNRLAKLAGAKFDREYTAQVGLKHQQDDLRMYERAGLAAQDPMLKGWIARSLPAMRYHLAAAQRIAVPQPAAPIKVRLPRSRPPSPLLRQAAVQPVAAWPSGPNTR
jgi:predicted outer membrane protein